MSTNIFSSLSDYRAAACTLNNTLRSVQAKIVDLEHQVSNFFCSALVLQIIFSMNLNAVFILLFDCISKKTHLISESDASRSTGSEEARNYNGAAGACLCREL